MRMVRPSATRQAALSGDAALCIVDLPYDAGAFVRAAGAAGVAVLGLDYHGDTPPDISVCLFDDSSVSDGARRVIGLDYAIIRADVAQQGRCPQGEGVLVMIGGADIHNDAPAIARTLAARGARVTLVRGPLCDDDETAAGPHSGQEYVTLKSPEDLARRMAGCCWAVSNGGTSMLEFMSLGKAVHVIAQTKQERLFAKQVFARGGLIGIGVDSLDVPDAATRRRVGEQAATLVDGRGLERIADLAEGLIR